MTPKCPFIIMTQDVFSFLFPLCVYPRSMRILYCISLTIIYTSWVCISLNILLLLYKHIPLYWMWFHPYIGLTLCIDRVSITQIHVLACVTQKHCHWTLEETASFLPCHRLGSKDCFLTENKGRTELFTSFRHIVALMLKKPLAACQNELLLPPTYIMVIIFVHQILGWLWVLIYIITHPLLDRN